MQNIDKHAHKLTDKYVEHAAQGLNQLMTQTNSCKLYSCFMNVSLKAT